MDVGIPVDSPNLVLLFYVVQLFLRELHKSKNLIQIIPMDMSGYYGKSGTIYSVSLRGDEIIISKSFKEPAGKWEESTEHFAVNFFSRVRGRNSVVGDFNLER